MTRTLLELELAAARIERVRDKIDHVLCLGVNPACRVVLLEADKLLKLLKADMGFPKAGL